MKTIFEGDIFARRWRWMTKERKTSSSVMGPCVGVSCWVGDRSDGRYRNVVPPAE